MDEIWKPIEGHPFYEVSNLGRVRSLDRMVQGRGFLKEVFQAGRILKLGRCTNGYVCVILGKGNNKLVHRLVAEAFVPGDPALTVNHKDLDRTHNVATNLEWVTMGDNHRHSYASNTRKRHAATRQVVVGGVCYETVNAAADALLVTSASVSSAAKRGHKVKGLEASYVG
jgi:hypothetical protein